MKRMPWMRVIALTLVVSVNLGGVNARAEDPKAAARAIGDAGRAAAAAVARDPASVSKVPGYAGTNLPERDLGAAELEAAAERVLSDPEDPGGWAGRAVIEGATGRPDASVGAEDPIPVRGEEIQADPSASRFGASGLASGSVRECGAGVEDAGAGGACGSVSWCVGADCETASSQANTGFIDSAARLNMVLELGGEEFDRENLRFFRGERRSCRIRWGGLADCCKDSGLLIDLAECTEGERLLAQERHAGNTHYLGTRCAKRILGVCIRLGRLVVLGPRARTRCGYARARQGRDRCKPRARRDRDRTRYPRSGTGGPRRGDGRVAGARSRQGRRRGRQALQ